MRGSAAHCVNFTLGEWRARHTLGKPHLAGPGRDDGPTAHWINLVSQEGWRAHCTLGKPPLSSLCKLHPERVKGLLHTGWTLSFRPSYGWGAYCTLPAKLHLQEGWGLAAHWLNPYLSEGMRGPLHTRYTSSFRRDEGPTGDWLNLILRMDEGLVAHWVTLIFQGQLGMRGPLNSGYTSSLRRDEGPTVH